MAENSTEISQDAIVERTAEVIAEQQEAVGKLSGIDNELSLIKAMLDKWGELADKEYLSEARQALSTLHHRLQDTERPRE